MCISEMEDEVRIGILLVYCPPCGSTFSLPELAELVLGLVLDSPHLLVLANSNIHVEAGVAQDFMTSVATMSSSKVVPALTHAAGHTLGTWFSVLDTGDLGVH